VQLSINFLTVCPLFWYLG